ncbi:MAG: hypothetical protein HKN91_06870, partial [Acidimicrobiia bacterium]|nr:hypothetical protein [Acidimicrobiia bacterium]
TLFLSACGEDLGEGPSIDSLIVDPDVVAESDTGMTDEFFVVTINFSGFEEPVDPDLTRVFIQQPERDAVAGSTDVTGNTITMTMIAKTWTVGLDTGQYNVGAEVRSATESVTQRDLATITIEE